MRKILKEVIAVLIVLVVAAALIVGFITYNSAQTAYDTLAGNVNKLPLNITSPVYGMVVSLPVQEGDTVRIGQTLATIQVLNKDGLPASSSLYHVQGKILTIISPANGIVGHIAFAPLSTVAGASSLMELYTSGSMQLQVLLPHGAALSDYIAFYAAAPTSISTTTRYLLHIRGQIPTNVIANVDPSTSVYRASCAKPCDGLLPQQGIAVYGQRKQAHYPIIDAWLSLWENLVQTHGN